MARQVIQLPVARYLEQTGSNASAIWDWGSARSSHIRIDDSLVDGATRYLDQIAVFSSGSLAGYVSLYVSSDTTEGGFSGGDDLSSAFETRGSITLEAAGQSVVVQVASGDTSEPYLFRPSNSSEVSTFASAVISAYSVGNGAGTLTLYDGVATAPEAPTAPVSSSITHSSIKFDWLAPDYDGGSVITSYEFQWRESGEEWSDSNKVAVSTSSRTYTLESLDGSTTYEARVLAVNSVGRGAWSDIESVTTLAVSPLTVSITSPSSGTRVKGGTLVSLVTTVTGPSYTTQWTATGGTIDNPSAENTTWTAPASQSNQIEYTLTLTATTSGGETASDSITINVYKILDINDFDSASYSTEFTALVQTTGNDAPGILYATSPRGTAGQILSGNLRINNTNMTWVRFRESDASHLGAGEGNNLIIINDNDSPGSLDLMNYYESGDGQGLSLFFQTVEGVAEFQYSRGGGNFSWWRNASDDTESGEILSNIEPGDRYIIAIGKEIAVDITAELASGSPTLSANLTKADTNKDITVPALTAGAPTLSATLSKQEPARKELTIGAFSSGPPTLSASLSKTQPVVKDLTLDALSSGNPALSASLAIAGPGVEDIRATINSGTPTLTATLTKLGVSVKDITFPELSSGAPTFSVGNATKQAVTNKDITVDAIASGNPSLAASLTKRAPQYNDITADALTTGNPSLTITFLVKETAALQGETNRSLVSGDLVILDGPAIDRVTVANNRDFIAVTRSTTNSISFSDWAAGDGRGYSFYFSCAGRTFEMELSAATIRNDRISWRNPDQCLVDESRVELVIGDSGGIGRRGEFRPVAHL